MEDPEDHLRVNSVGVSAGAGAADASRVRSVRDLHVFRMAHKGILAVYEATRNFPKGESRGLVSQLRRAAASVPANLVEGAARNHRGEYRQFVGIARASAAEVSYHLLLAHDLGFLAHDAFRDLDDRYDQIGRMLTRLGQSLEPRAQ